MACELLHHVLQHNEACTKAYEYAGYIAQKIKHTKVLQTSMNMHGNLEVRQIQLAFNYVKGKRYPDAIDVCQQVLRVQPDYLWIHKEILEK